jgi:putative tricarboxylic transport membrane protein
LRDVKSRRHTLLPYVLVLAGALGLGWQTLHFEFTPRGDRPGPDVWPRAILALMIVACGVRIVGVLRRRPDERAGVLDDVLGDALPGVDREVPDTPAQRYPLLLAIGVALTIAYVALLATLGFFCDTVLYIAALIRSGRYRRWPVIAVVSVVGALAFMFVFMKVVYLSLPIGRPPFAEVSLALMQLMGIR